MLRRILVPLDGSARAESALPVAARAARGSGSTLVLCRMVGRPSEFALYGAKAPGVSPSETQMRREQALEYLTAVTEHEALADVQTETVVSEGLVAEEILATISTRAIDLVVMCSHGHSEPTRWLLGSVAEKVARLSEAPVLVLRERGIAQLEQAIAQPTGACSLRALIPLDGSPLAEAALQPTADLVAALVPQAPVTIHLISVLPPNEEMRSGALAQERGERIAQEDVVSRLNAYLARVASRLRQDAPGQRQLEISWSVARNLDVAATILRTAGQEPEPEPEPETETELTPERSGHPGACYLIAMTTHGSGGKRPWSIGTVADRILYSSELPILLIRP